MESKKDKLLAYITATATADSEEDVQALMGLFQPQPDRKSAGSMFEEVLGWNPVVHYDMEDVLGILDTAMSQVSKETAELIMGQKDSLAQKALAHYQRYHDDYLKNAVLSALWDVVPQEEWAALKKSFNCRKRDPEDFNGARRERESSWRRDMAGQEAAADIAGTISGIMEDEVHTYRANPIRKGEDLERYPNVAPDEDYGGDDEDEDEDDLLSGLSLKSKLDLNDEEDEDEIGGDDEIGFDDSDDEED